MEITVHSDEDITFIQTILFICVFERVCGSRTLKYVPNTNNLNICSFLCKLFSGKRETILNGNCFKD